MAAVPVFYEAPSRRQYFRTTSPAEVTIGGRRYRTANWSVGGFAIERCSEAAPGERVEIGFAVDFQGFAISFCATAEVLRVSNSSLAARFVNLGERESNLLRYFSSALISGQMVAVDGVLKNVDRPVTKTRRSPYGSFDRRSTLRR